jgi:hypothetical protein
MKVNLCEKWYKCAARVVIHRVALYCCYILLVHVFVDLEEYF